MSLSFDHRNYSFVPGYLSWDLVGQFNDAYSMFESIVVPAPDYIDFGQIRRDEGIKSIFFFVAYDLARKKFRPGERGVATVNHLNIRTGHPQAVEIENTPDYRQRVAILGLVGKTSVTPGVVDRGSSPRTFQASPTYRVVLESGDLLFVDNSDGDYDYFVLQADDNASQVGVVTFNYQ